MSKTLLVGATGQLGTAAAKKLAAHGLSIRAMIRGSQGANRMHQLGIETVTGDLTQPSTLPRCCEGISTIVATANAAIPSRPSDTFAAVEREGYRSLIRTAAQAGVSRFIYTSVPVSRYTGLSPFLRYKRETEETLLSSGLDAVIFRAGIFMDIAFAMLGSDLPIQGAEGATVLRPFRFAASHFQRIRNSIEHDHVALIPGDGQARHRFICVDDVAAFLCAAALGGPTGVYTIGGPQPLSFLDVAALYEQILGHKLRTRHLPSWVFRCAIPVLRRLSPAGANLMCLNYIACKEETLDDPAPAASAFGITLTSAETFLRSKLRADSAAG